MKTMRMGRTMCSRRRFLSGASAFGVASFLGVPRTRAAEQPPETRKIRFYHGPAICLAPQYLAGELLQLEGFEEVEYVKLDTMRGPAAVASGRADLTLWDIPSLVLVLDAGEPLVLLGGVHAGCYELFGRERGNAIRDLKGRTIAVNALGGSDHVFVAVMLAYVGIDPHRDVPWLPGKTLGDGMRVFAEGKADAMFGFPPEPQELRQRQIGHVLVNTTQDRPWSEDFCCAMAANREYVRKYPIATKRALRAILKSADLCAQEPERVARYLADKGIEPRYDIGLEVLQSLPYRHWRDADPEDTLRFHALRRHEVGMIKTSPQKLIAHGTDWRFFRELQKELKA
jgi:NitT/TauT family transport system substrate-binding protein